MSNLRPFEALTYSLLGFCMGMSVERFWINAPNHLADASTMVGPAPVVERWTPGEPFSAESVVAEPTGRVR